MQITSDGLKLKNEGRVFHICETQEEVEKALDLLAKLRMSICEREKDNEDWERTLRDGM